MSEDQKKQLQTQLWNIANELRGKMGADEFRDYILGFIFYKYLSEKILLYANELLESENKTYDQIIDDPKVADYLEAIKKASLDKDILKEDKSGQPTVLVVDDDESLQSLFKIFLKKIGFSRVVVGTVKEALLALSKQHFDLLFLDLKLPDGPADDVYDAAKAADPELPIVIITGYPDSEMLDRILMKGPITVLKKPLQIEQLHHTVRILGHKDIAKLAA